MSKPTALGVDIFAGLFTCGVRQAGFEVLGHLEHGAYGVKTAQANFPKLDIRVGKENWDPKRFDRKVDFVFSNPPCAAWSPMRGGSLGSWQQQVERLDYIRDGVALACGMRGLKAWCWESVPNAWRHGRLFYLEQAERLCAAGFHATVLQYDNRWLGVPQRRPRVMLIGHRHPLVYPRMLPQITVDQALRTVPRRLTLHPPVGPKPGSIKIQRNWDRLWRESAHCKGRLYTAFHRLGEPEDMPRPLAIVTRLRSDEPAPVMINTFSRLHPHEPREFTWHEWLALCGCPLDWKTAAGHWDAATRELARAVMPPVGRWVGTAVRRGLERPALRGRPAVRVVDLRDPERTVEPELLWTLGDHPHERMPPPPPPTPSQQQAMAKTRVGYKKGRTRPRFYAYDKDGDGLRHHPSAKRQASTVGRAARPPRLGSGHRIRCMLKGGRLSIAQILDVVHREFPESKATASDVYWNRRRLKQRGGVP